MDETVHGIKYSNLKREKCFLGTTSSWTTTVFMTFNLFDLLHQVTLCKQLLFHQTSFLFFVITHNCASVTSKYEQRI